jgi:hypothetical protein
MTKAVTQLEVEEIFEYEGCSLVSYHARGHWPAEDFVEYAKEELDVELNPADVKQCFARNVPVGGKGNHDTLMYYWVEQGRGAYPVTIVEM